MVKNKLVVIFAVFLIGVISYLYVINLHKCDIFRIDNDKKIKIKGEMHNQDYSLWYDVLYIKNNDRQEIEFTDKNKGSSCRIGISGNRINNTCKSNNIIPAVYSLFSQAVSNITGSNCVYAKGVRYNGKSYKLYTGKFKTLDARGKYSIIDMKAYVRNANDVIMKLFYHRYKIMTITVLGVKKSNSYIVPSLAKITFHNSNNKTYNFSLRLLSFSQK